MTTNTIQMRSRTVDGVPQYPEAGMQRREALDNRNISPGVSDYDFGAERKVSDRHHLLVTPGSQQHISHTDADG